MNAKLMKLKLGVFQFLLLMYLVLALNSEK